MATLIERLRSRQCVSEDGDLLHLAIVELERAMRDAKRMKDVLRELVRQEDLITRPDTNDQRSMSQCLDEQRAAWQAARAAIAESDEEEKL